MTNHSCIPLFWLHSTDLTDHRIYCFVIWFQTACVYSTQLYTSQDVHPYHIYIKIIATLPPRPNPIIILKQQMVAGPVPHIQEVTVLDQLVPTSLVGIIVSCVYLRCKVLYWQAGTYFGQRRTSICRQASISGCWTFASIVADIFRNRIEIRWYQQQTSLLACRHLVPFSCHA